MTWINYDVWKHRGTDVSGDCFMTDTDLLCRKKAEMYESAPWGQVLSKHLCCMQVITQNKMLWHWQPAWAKKLYLNLRITITVIIIIIILEINLVPQRFFSSKITGLESQVDGTTAHMQPFKGQRSTSHVTSPTLGFQKYLLWHLTQRF